MNKKSFEPLVIPNINNLNKDRLEEMIYWIMERMNIHYKRFCKKEPPPWTSDPVLQTKRFCLPFRELDKGTQLYIEHTKGYNDLNGLFLYTLLYRVHNSRWFFEMLPAPLTIEEYLSSWDEIVSRYRRLREANKFRLAYLTPPPAVGRRVSDKYIEWLKWTREHIDIFKISDKPEIYSSGNAFVDYMEKNTKTGRFISYEIATDMSYSHLTPYDDNFLEIGPGAIAGVNILVNGPEESYTNKYGSKVIGNSSNLDSYREFIYNLVDVINNELPKGFFYLVRECGVNKDRMVLRDVEHSLCEFRKYFNDKYGIQKNRRLFKL